MNLTKDQKKENAAKLAEELKGASLFFASYQGLKFQNLATLRSKLSASKCQFRVVRNSIVNHALKGAGIENMPEASLLKGPTAIAIQKDGEIVDAAKTLVAFEKEFPALKLRACYASNMWYNVNECKRLAAVASRPELISQLAGNLYSCVSNIASVLQAPMRDLAFVLKALEEKKQNGATAA